MHDPVIKLEKIFFSYPDGRKALDDVNLEISRGEKIGLIGPNGAGKTTLFNIMMGLLKPGSGRIEILGNECTKEKDFKVVRQKIGFLFQNSDDQLFCPTVMEDVAFGPLNLGMSPKEARSVVGETLELLGISRFAQRVTHRLSQGEKKIVALASILAMGPEILILDEPSAGLDSATTKKIINILEDLDLTYIVTSHDMDFMLRLTDKIYELDSGKITKAGTGVTHSHVHVHKAGEVPHSHEER